jgi:lipopolysaccharide/colanic/teichoic acid biosynthesis glycosyltransferase
VIADVVSRLMAVFLAFVLIPVLAAIAVLVRLDSPGPAFYRQVRVGRDGTPFVMWKFRTMTLNADAHLPELYNLNEADGPLFKIRDDPRITRVGRWLRRLSLDELPQLLNVVHGDMTLVGPRPALPSEVARYDDDDRRRLAVKPGVTGLWQVSGRSDLSWTDGSRFDLLYVDNWSFMLDLRILARTVHAVVRPTGAY